MGLRDSVAEDSYVRALQGLFGQQVCEAVEKSIIAGCGVLIIITPTEHRAHLSQNVPFGEIRIVDAMRVAPDPPETGE